MLAVLITCMERKYGTRQIQQDLTISGKKTANSHVHSSIVSWTLWMKMLNSPLEMLSGGVVSVLLGIKASTVKMRND